MLALAMVSLEMEKLIPDWLPLTIELLQKAQVAASFAYAPHTFVSLMELRGYCTVLK